MAIPSGTKRAPILKVDLESKFDVALNSTLASITPRVPQNNPAPKALGHPDGARILICYFVDQNGCDLAHAYKFLTRAGRPLGDREYYPTGLLSGEFWFHL